MGEIASAGQLRMSLARWAMVTVPATVLLGFLSGRLANSGYGNPWFDALSLPESFPPGWVFGAVWSVLYVLLGIALAIVINARGAQGRAVALGLYGAQFALNLVWSPLFFALHQVTLALVLMIVLLALAIATTVAFARIRKQAAWLMLPYLVWLSMATILNFQVDRLNPDAETLVPGTGSAQILL
jgi:tryptophan-rich sensory protein